MKGVIPGAEELIVLEFTKEGLDYVKCQRFYF
jgi:hypothetical protein